MPPKKTNTDLIVLKLKRWATTCIVDLSVTDTVGTLKQKIVDMVNSTNGLKLDDKPVSLEEQAALERAGLVDVDIPIPNIGLNNSDSEDEEVNDAANANDDTKSTATELNDNSNLQLTIDSIALGKFENNSDIYNSQIVELDVSDDTKIGKLELSDFTALAYKLKSEDFVVYKPQYE